jgi:hypothetical protein
MKTKKIVVSFLRHMIKMKIFKKTNKVLNWLRGQTEYTVPPEEVLISPESLKRMAFIPKVVYFQISMRRRERKQA